jgi:hypothetical protein
MISHAPLFSLYIGISRNVLNTGSNITVVKPRIYDNDTIGKQSDEAVAM